MHYTLHQLRIFLKVAHYQSITKAADELHLTQPAISIQLKKLQNQFEIPLTEVIGRQLYITEFGKEIAERSMRLLEEAEGIKYTVNQYKGLLTGRINVASVSTGKYVIPYFLKPFMDQFPGISINLDVSNKNKVIEGLLENQSDFSLVSVLPENIPIHKVPLMENRLWLAGHIDFLKKIKSKRDLEKVTFLFREQGSATRRSMEDYIIKHKIEVKKSMELVSNEAIKQAINAGIGVSVMPLIGLRTAMTNEEIRIIPFKGFPIVTQWNLIYRKDKNLSPAHQALISFIQEHKNQIVAKHFEWALGDN